MKNFFLFVFLFISVLVSCDKKEDESTKKEIIEKQKYQIEILDIVESKEYYSIVLDKTNGKVFVGQNSANWYEATHNQSLPESKENRYVIKVRKIETPKGIVPQIILFDEVTSEIYVYVVQNVSDFYSVMSPFDVIEK